MENILLGLEAIFNFQTLFILLIGVFVGIIVGCIPGFTITMGVALTLPFSFGMDPINGIALMMGVQVGGSSGGLITASLLGIPGTPSAMATTFDGYPMAQKEPGKALAIGLWSSFFGSVIAGIVLILAAPMLSQWAVKFGPWEYFALMVFGLSAIASLGGDSLTKGLLSGSLGMMFALVGMDPILGSVRFTFGYDQLMSGFDFLPVLIGIFAFSQLLSDIKNPPKAFKFDKNVKVSYPFGKLIKDFGSSIGNLVRSSFIGTFVGALPAAGGSIANILSYDIAKKFSKKPENYGKGEKDGLIAAETANNASAGGALIPMLAFGIPGDAVTAMMLGALMIHGLQPGPLLITSQPVLAYGVYLSFFMAAVFMVIVQSFGIKVFLRLNQISQHYLIPGILMLCALGSFAINNRIFDVWVLLAFGLIGFWLKSNGFPLAPFILGIILGPMAEENLRRALSTDPNVMLFFTRPISAVLIFMGIASVLFAIFSQVRTAKKAKRSYKGQPIEQRGNVS
jgi:putative tricarboxylic transport membrane protein